MDNPSNFLSPFQFEITFECIQQLEHDIEWKVIYVGSAENSSHDQVLDEILVGPVPLGLNKFILEADPPNPENIPKGDLLGMTVLLVTCSYRDQEFIRIGYYVHNEYVPFEGYDPEQHGEIDMSKVDLSKVGRSIVADKPRVTRFPIQWSGDVATNASSAQEQQVTGNEAVDEDDIIDDSNEAEDIEEEEEDDDDDMSVGLDETMDEGYAAQPESKFTSPNLASRHALIVSPDQNVVEDMTE